MEKLVSDLLHGGDSVIIRLVIVAVVMDTVLGVIRAIKQHSFNSCFGIDGAVRKATMIVSIIFLLIVDGIVQINLIGFIPDNWLKFITVESVGLSEFFGILYLSYETVSILKNMTLCGLPVKFIWDKSSAFLSKYTDELERGVK